MSLTTVTCLEGLLAACPDMPHDQRNGERPTIDLQKQELIMVWTLGNPESLRSVVISADISSCPVMPHDQRNGERLTIDLQKQVFIKVWILGNPESLRSVADRFDVSKSSALHVYHRVFCLFVCLWSDCKQSFQSVN